MSENKQQPPISEPPRPQGSVESMSLLDDNVELEVRIHNPLNRAIHLISDLRGLIYDPATRRLQVQLSDRGRELPPGGIAMEPRFRSVDPDSESLITIKLPRTIVKLADTPSPTGEVLFEEHDITNASEIQVEIGWSDTPYYRDPREKSRGEQTISTWEQESLQITYTSRPRQR